MFLLPAVWCDLVQVLYSDYVMKNPFHQLEMPVRSELFDINLNALVQRRAA